MSADGKREGQTQAFMAEMELALRKNIEDYFIAKLDRMMKYIAISLTAIGALFTILGLTSLAQVKEKALDSVQDTLSKYHLDQELQRRIDLSLGRMVVADYRARLTIPADRGRITAPFVNSSDFDTFVRLMSDPKTGERDFRDACDVFRRINLDPERGATRSALFTSLAAAKSDDTKWMAQAPTKRGILFQCARDPALADVGLAILNDKNSDKAVLIPVLRYIGETSNRAAEKSLEGFAASDDERIKTPALEAMARIDPHSKILTDLLDQMHKKNLDDKDAPSVAQEVTILSALATVPYGIFVPRDPNAEYRVKTASKYLEPLIDTGVSFFIFENFASDTGRLILQTSSNNASTSNGLLRDDDLISKVLRDAAGDAKRFLHATAAFCLDPFGRCSSTISVTMDKGSSMKLPGGAAVAAEDIDGLVSLKPQKQAAALASWRSKTGEQKNGVVESFVRPELIRFSLTTTKKLGEDGE